MRQTDNSLLQLMSDEVFAAISPSLEPIDLVMRERLEEPGEEIKFIYFIESGIVSRIVSCGDERIEIGLTGREGAVGTSILQDWSDGMSDSFVQLAGRAHRISAATILSHALAAPELAKLLLRFNLLQATQTAQTVLANGRFTILERTARWILMYHDRVSADDLRLTHEFLALMLGVRRAGVTADMHILEGENAIRNQRGVITIRDRGKLEGIAGSAYGGAEAKYAEVLGRDFRMGHIIPDTPVASIPDPQRKGPAKTGNLTGPAGRA